MRKSPTLVSPVDRVETTPAKLWGMCQTKKISALFYNIRINKKYMSGRKSHIVYLGCSAYSCTLTRFLETYQRQRTRWRPFLYYLDHTLSAGYRASQLNSILQQNSLLLLSAKWATLKFPMGRNFEVLPVNTGFAKYHQNNLEIRERWINCFLQKGRAPPSAFPSCLFLPYLQYSGTFEWRNGKQLIKHLMGINYFTLNYVPCGSCWAIDYWQTYIPLGISVI